MARALETASLTLADELRALLAETEKQIAHARRQGARAGTEVCQLLANLDRIGELWPELAAAGMDMRPEAGRWETLQAQLHARAGAVAADLRRAGGLPALRRAEESRRLAGGVPPAAGSAANGHGVSSPVEPLAWWWYLDREAAERNRSQVVRWGTVLLAAVIAVAGAIFLFNHLFPVDPHVSAAATHLSNGQQLIDNHADYAGALAEFQAAAVQTPGDPELWLWIGATQQKLGQDPGEAFSRGRSLAANELDFLMSRAASYTSLNMLAAARADLTATLAMDPQNPQAYYFLANVDEAAGNLQAAAADLDQASNYADARKQSELVAMSRVRLGFLLQRMQTMQAGGATPTASGE